MRASRTARVARRALAGRGAGIFVGLLGLATVAAVAHFGPLAALVVIAVLGWLLLFARPKLALAMLVVTTVLFEADPEGFFPVTARFYTRLTAAITITDLLFAAFLGGVALRVARRPGLARAAGPLTLPLLLFAVALLMGGVTGYFGNGDAVDALNSGRVVVYLIVLPFLVANVLDGRRDVLAAVAIAGALAVFKAFEGLLGYALGEGGREITDIGARLTYYEPTPNWLLTAYILAVAAAVLVRVHLPRWAAWPVPIAVATLALSFRRSFWIAAVLGLVVVLVLARETLRRRVLLPAALVVVGALWVASAVGGSSVPGAEDTLLARAKTVVPVGLESRPGDRYRIEERRNVVAVALDHPITGLGLGVHWEPRYPISQFGPGAGYYTHIVAMTLWLRLGIVGVVAYVTLMATAIVVAYRISRRHADPVVRAAGLALVGAFTGLMVAETTASFTGVGLRFTILFAVTLGVLGTARREVAAPRSTR